MQTSFINKSQSSGTISSQKKDLPHLSVPSISKSIFENVTLENIYHAMKYLPKDALLACDRFFNYRSNPLSAANNDSINSQKKSIFHVAIEYLYPTTMLQEAIDKVLEDWKKSSVVLNPDQEDAKNVILDQATVLTEKSNNPQMEAHKKLLFDLNQAEKSQTSTYSPHMDETDLGVFRATHKDTVPNNKSNENGFYETILADVEAYKNTLQKKFVSTNTGAATKSATNSRSIILQKKDKEDNLKELLRRIPKAIREKITFDPAPSSSPNTTR